VEPEDEDEELLLPLGWGVFVPPAEEEEEVVEEEEEEEEVFELYKGGAATLFPRDCSRGCGCADARPTFIPLG